MTSHERHRQDAAVRVLEWIVRMMPTHRREWADAMRAELSYIEGRAPRWNFVASCTWAALRSRAFEGGSKTLAIAFLASGLMVAPLMGLSVASDSMAALWRVDAAALFGVLWALGATGILMTRGLVASTHARNPRAWLVIVRLVVLVLAAGGWLAISADQMPCFLGEPNCD